MINSLATVSLCLSFFVGAYARVTEKIIGGTPASISEYPFVVSLRRNGEHFCGGTIISDRHILTAGHCVQGVMTAPYSNIAVVSGSSMSSGSSGQSHSVRNTEVYPSFVGRADSFHHDVAVLTLSNSITFNTNQQKIELPTSDVQYGIFSKTKAMVSGWGIQSYPSSSAAPVLQKAQMSLIPKPACMKNVPQAPVYNEQVCALQKEGVGLCDGDSGGPLFTKNHVIGIASWVIPCATGLPDIYTKVYSYRQWIRDAMARH